MSINLLLLYISCVQCTSKCTMYCTGPMHLVGNGGQGEDQEYFLEDVQIRDHHDHVYS